MKLYVIDKEDKAKVYINKVAGSREELRKLIGKDEFSVKGKVYHVTEVHAAKETNNSISGAIIGGALGLFAGPIGIALGGFTGAVLGQIENKRKSKHVHRFNQSGRIILNSKEFLLEIPNGRNTKKRKK